MSNESAVQPGNAVQAAFNDEASLLNDAELEAVSGGTPTVSRVKTSDKHQQAVLAFIKG